MIYLFNMVNPTSKLTIIRLDLSHYDFDVEYVKGKHNVSDAEQTNTKFGNRSKTV